MITGNSLTVQPTSIIHYIQIGLEVIQIVFAQTNSILSITLGAKFEPDIITMIIVGSIDYIEHTIVIVIYFSKAGSLMRKMLSSFYYP